MINENNYIQSDLFYLLLHILVLFQISYVLFIIGDRMLPGKHNKFIKYI